MIIHSLLSFALISAHHAGLAKLLILLCCGAVSAVPVAAPPAITNLGRQIQFISGIPASGAGSQGLINMPTNLRAHRANFQCSGIAYQSPTATLAAGDTGTGTFTLTVVNGVITAVAITATNSTKGAGTYALTILDSLTVLQRASYRIGTGATGTYTVNGGNVITAAAITSGGVVGPVPPEVLITTWKTLVNGINMRDISPANIMNIYSANPTYEGQRTGINMGEFPIFFTEPWRNFSGQPTLTSWDLFGQGTWQFQYAFANNVTSPAIVGSYEFDGQRNAVTNSKGQQVPFLQPVSQHQFGYPVPLGRYDVTTLPWQYPIARLWCYETDSTTGAFLAAGCIYQLELIQNGNIVLQATQAQVNQSYAEYGFDMNIFSSAFIADPDQNIFESLHNGAPFILRVYSLAAANLTVVAETLPGNYSA